MKLKDNLKEIESYILTRCGWTQEQLQYQGVQTYKVSSRTDKNLKLAYVLTNKTSDEITVLLAVPDQYGDKMKLTFNRKTKKVDINQSDSDINTLESLDAFLNIIASTIKNTEGMFLPTIKDNIVKNYSE